MINRFLKIFLYCFLIFSFTLTSCSNDNSDSCEHSFSNIWEYDSIYHWHRSICGHDVESDKEKHMFKVEVTNPTYESGGYTTYTCSTCGYSYTDDETDALTHNYSNEWSYDSSSHWHSCIDQGYENLKKDESNHNFTKSVTNPTYESGGYTTYTCSTCGYSYTDDETDALTISITWKNYDGTVLEVDKNVPYGTMPTYDGATPIKESSSNYDYLFTGWTPDVVIATTSATYVATFSSTAINYSISYELDGGVGDNPTSYSAESGNITLAEPTKNGYEFIGWTGSNGNIPQKNIVIDCESGTDYLFVANWNLLSYTITYHLFGGKNNIKNPLIYTIEDTIMFNPAVKDHYNFEGWYLDEKYENQVTSLTGLYGDLNLFAKFTPQVFNATFNISDDCYYTITYTLDGITPSKIIKVYPNESYDIYDYIPSKSGYIFDGRYDETGVCVKENIKLNKDMVLHPVFVETSFKHSYYGDDLSRSSSKDLSRYLYSFGEGASETWYMYVPNYFNGKANVIAKGTWHISWPMEKTLTSSCNVYDLYTGKLVWGKSFRSKVGQGSHSFDSGFEDINLEPGHSYRIVLNISEYDEGNIHFSCTSSYDSIESQICKDNEIPYDSNLNAFLPHRDGYDFAGWYDEENDPIHDIWDYDVDKSFYATWELHEYNITYNLDGGKNDSSNPSSFTCTDNIELLPPSREGYTFDGWYTDQAFNNKIESINSGSLYSDLTLYAKWIPNNYTLTLNYEGGQNCPVVEFYSEGSLINSIVLYKDKKLNYFVPESSDPSLIFAGWYTDSDLCNRFSFEGIINKDTKLYAKWIEVKGQYADLGSNIEVSIDGKNEKYIEIVSLEDQIVNISSLSDLDIYGAIYDEDMNLIISNDDISDTDLDFSLSANLKGGHKYYILYRANQVNVAGEAIINIGGEQTPNSSLVGDYTNIVETMTVTYGTFFVLPEPHKEGYEFIGWFDEEGNLIDTSSWNYTGDITIYAHREVI